MKALHAVPAAASQFFAAVLLIGMSPPAQAIDLRGTVWEEGARAAGVADPLLLYAISLVEAGRRAPAGHEIAPWPWTVRTPTGAVFAATREEAIAAVRSVPRDSNTDVGLMQVNLRANGHLAPTPEALVDPEKNIRVAAAILRRAMDSAPFDPLLGVGRYHSWTEWRALEYGRMVWQTYFALAAVRRAAEGEAGR